MALPETARPSGPAPAVSVLVTTYNRSALLRRALASVLKQDFDSFEVVVVDDNSTDDTPEVMRQYGDPRIRYVRNAENMARKSGDRSIFQHFVDELARGDFFLWLCDDDYWVPSDLLRRQVRIMRDHPNVAMVFGAMAQLYPTAIPLPRPPRPYIRHEYIGDRRDLTFARGIYPSGLLPSETFLALFAEDPANRNSVTGATMFRARSFREADVFAHAQEVRWQSGYLMLAGTATAGDVWYLDEPCVVATVEIDSASYRGSQLDHMLDCMRSIDAAFHRAAGDSDPRRSARMQYFRAKMKHSVFQVYLSNKINYRLGSVSIPLEGILNIFKPEITARQFLTALRANQVPASAGNKIAVVISALPPPFLRLVLFGFVRGLRFRDGWWWELARFSHPAPSELRS
jgi:glycosyltransferase involved in cell wall biosynthesis